MLDRLALEDEPSVRAAICETIGRLPYARAEDVDRAEQALVSHAAASANTTDRLGVAKGLELRVRLHRQTLPPGARAIAVLRALAGVASARGSLPPQPRPLHSDPLRDVRVRRLALESLILAATPAGDIPADSGIVIIDDELVERAARRSRPAGAAPGHARRRSCEVTRSGCAWAWATKRRWCGSRRSAA